MNADVLKTNVSGLTDEQVSKIVELSTNELEQKRQEVTNEVTGTIYGNLDTDLESLGYAKPNGVRTFDHIKSTISTLKEKSGQMSGLQSEIDRLKAELAKGASDDVKQQIAQLQSSLNDVNEQLTKERQLHAEDNQKHEGAMRDYQFNLAVKDALAGVKFKDGISDAVKKLMINEACKEVLKDRTFKTDAEGNMTFYDANGTIITNPNDMAKPYTLKALLTDKTTLGDIIDKRKVEGAGGRGGGQQNNYGINLTGKTRIEANDAIESYLFSKGYTVADAKFQEEKDKIWKELNVSALPMGF